MRRIQFGVSLFLVAALAGIAVIQFSGRKAGASALSQTEIEGKAIDYAKHVGLTGAPTSVASKEMTLSEFNARLDPFSNDQVNASSLVWLVVLNGNVTLENPASPQSSATSTQYNNIWVLLSPAGDVRGWGAQTPGNEIDLNAPAKPITSWPTPVNQTKWRSVPTLRSFAALRRRSIP